MSSCCTNNLQVVRVSLELSVLVAACWVDSWYGPSKLDPHVGSLLETCAWCCSKLLGHSSVSTAVFRLHVAVAACQLRVQFVLVHRRRWLSVARRRARVVISSRWGVSRWSHAFDDAVRHAFADAHRNDDASGHGHGAARCSASKLPAI